MSIGILPKKYEMITYEKRDRIGYITLNRPKVLNAINYKLQDELIDVCQIIDDNEDVEVVIITGAGERAFSAGADVREFLEEEATTTVVERRERGPWGRGLEAVAALNRPVIAAINGYALGGGLELALCCDIRIACEMARFGLPEVSLGLIPGWGGTQRLPRAIGKAKALEMILTGNAIDAQEALRVNLVTMIVPLAELMPTAEKIAKTIMSRGPLAVRYAKEAVNKGLDITLEQGLRLEGDLSFLLQTTEDRAEGIKAFLEKRPPQYKGK